MHDIMTETALIQPDKGQHAITLHLVNNPRLKDRYRATGVDQRFAEVLDRVKPDLVHVGHLNHLSTSLPREAALREIRLALGDKKTSVS